MRKHTGRLIVGDGVSYDMDDRSTGLNNNVMIVGASGTGKTRGYVIPNLLQASGSYVVSDPKGNLYEKYGKMLERQGYTVKKLDFVHPEQSAHYNIFHYIRREQDIVKIAHMLTYDGGAASASRRDIDPFWDQAAQLLYESLIAYLWEFAPQEEQTIRCLLALLEVCKVEEDDGDKVTALDILMEEAEKYNEDCFAARHYRRFRIAASKTLRSILITATSKLGAFDTQELRAMLATDDLDIVSMGKEKTALFVVVSDTDRSLDSLVNLFFTQAMNELCEYADNQCQDSVLPIPVRFIMDDFATHCRINEFPRMIASIRSRGISVMLMLQAEAQLEHAYGEDGRTIIGNCDTYVYLGGNDLDTADAVAKRCNLPMQKILNMPVGSNWIFRRGQMPVNGRNVDLDKYLKALPREAPKQRPSSRQI